MYATAVVIPAFSYCPTAVTVIVMTMATVRMMAMVLAMVIVMIVILEIKLTSCFG